LIRHPHTGDHRWPAQRIRRKKSRRRSGTPKSKAGASKSAAATPGGRIYCPYNDEACRCGEFCITSAWSTPKNPGSHARALRRVVDNCAAQRRQRETDDAAEE